MNSIQNLFYQLTIAKKSNLISDYTFIFEENIMHITLPDTVSLIQMQELKLCLERNYNNVYRVALSPKSYFCSETPRYQNNMIFVWFKDANS